MENSPTLFTDVSQNVSFWNEYFLDSDSILLVGFVLLVFLVLQIAFIYWNRKKRSLLALLLSNLLVGVFTWITTLYFLYPDLVLSLVF